MSPAVSTLVLLVISNVFMTFAWYGNLRLSQAGISTNWPLPVVILLSWGVALIEYCFMIPANQMGFEGNGGPYSLVQLKVIQEAISLIVFTIIAMVMFQGVAIRWNHFLAFVLLITAVYLVFLDT